MVRCLQKNYFILYINLLIVDISIRLIFQLSINHKKLTL